jgi:DNA polymerase-4
MTTQTSQWCGRAILHVDMDAFFASVEQLDHPDWRGMPVIVGGSAEGRGVVSAASYEARAFGVRSAMPSAQARRLCPGAIWARGRFGRYRELSQQVMEILRSISPKVQQVSIDEAYLDVTPTQHSPLEPPAVAREIQRRVDDLGLSCSVGVATSKTVAKIASDQDKPHGITIVRPGDEAAFLAPLPVTAVPGVGAATATRLRDAGIRTLGELALLDDLSAGQLLGSAGPDLTQRARGIDERAVHDAEGVKSISHEHTFATDIRQRKDVERELRELVDRVAARMRRKQLAARTLTIKLRYADFTTSTASRTLDSATDLESEMAPVAAQLLHSAWTPGTGLRLIGFGVSGFAEPVRQLELLRGNDEDRPQRRALAESLDRIRQKFGEDAISLGVDEPDESSDE